MAIFFFLIAMVKALVPRYRYDQLMRLGWKVFLPFSLGWVVFCGLCSEIRLVLGAVRSLDGGRLNQWQILITHAPLNTSCSRISGPRSNLGMKYFFAP